jgi:putative chitobiose transport system permease protein
MIGSPQRAPWQRLMEKVLSYGVLLAILLLTALPYLWTLITAMRSPSENVFFRPDEFWPNFLPRNPTLDNFTNVWNIIPMGRFFLNTFLVAGLTVILNVLLASLAAYPLAKLRFRGRDTLFYIILGTLIVPEQLTMIPLYMLMTQTLGLGNTLIGLVLPFSVSAFGIFLIRQNYKAIPDDLIEAARLDGANDLAVWWRIMIPLARPGLAALAIFTFVGAWDRFLWPLLMLNDPQLYTLPLGLTYLNSQFSANARNIAAGTIIATIPMLVFFVAAQRYFIQGLSGAVKG